MPMLTSRDLQRERGTHASSRMRTEDMLPLYMPMRVAWGLSSHLLPAPAKLGLSRVSCMHSPASEMPASAPVGSNRLTGTLQRG